MPFAASPDFVIVPTVAARETESLQQEAVGFQLVPDHIQKGQRDLLCRRDDQRELAPAVQSRVQREQERADGTFTTLEGQTERRNQVSDPIFTCRPNARHDY